MNSRSPVVMYFGIGRYRFRQDRANQQTHYFQGLQRVLRARTLYLLDEPSTGLHPADMDKLMRVLDKLVQRGDTVVMAEHDKRIASEADWVLNLGPGSGEKGGAIVAAGTPEEVSHAGNSITAPYLLVRLKKRFESPRTN